MEVTPFWQYQMAVNRNKTIKRIAVALGTAVSIFGGIHLAFSIHNFNRQRVFERELEVARFSVLPHEGPPSATDWWSAVSTSDRFVSIPASYDTGVRPSVASRRLRFADESLICLGKTARIRSIWASLYPDFYGDTEDWTSDVWLRILEACPDLEALSLTGSLADDSVVAALPRLCPELKTLRIGWSKVHGQPRSSGCSEAKSISKRGLTQIDTLRALEVLDCRGVSLGKESIDAIARSQSIRLINVAGCGVKAEDVAQILKLRNDRLVVVSEYVEITEGSTDSFLEHRGTDSELSTDAELLKQEFPFAVLVTTEDWYRYRDIAGELPDRNNWHRVKWDLHRRDKVNCNEH